MCSANIYITFTAWLLLYYSAISIGNNKKVDNKVWRVYRTLQCRSNYP